MPNETKSRRGLFWLLVILLCAVLAAGLIFILSRIYAPKKDLTSLQEMPPAQQTEPEPVPEPEPEPAPEPAPEVEPIPEPEPEPEPIVLTEEELALLSEADFLAAGYDYDAAILLLQSAEGWEEKAEFTDAVAAYEAARAELVPYADMPGITHVFFHSLIVDNSRAFDGDSDQDGYNMYMTTISEFEAMLNIMYEKGYVLVSPYDVAHEVTDEEGNTRFQYGEILLPEGKTPFMMSQDDLNYYGYMIGSIDGINETPAAANTTGDGFAHRIIIGEDGYPTCEYMQADGTVVTGDYDLVPILERFIQEHPDFSYRGARAILAFTGYEGVLGYRTKPSYEAALGAEAYAAEVENATAVAARLRELGWDLASHSYGHINYGTRDPERVASDSDKWLETVGPILGEVDILIYPHGSDISGLDPYSFENPRFVPLYEDGFRYFFNVDSSISWHEVGESWFRGNRRNLDGYRMFHHPERVEDLFAVEDVWDADRPTPVPTIG